MRILGVDFGDKRTGVAISSEIGAIATPIKTIVETDCKKVAEKIAEIARENEVERIVVGFPKNMNGTLGDRAQKTLEFGEYLANVASADIVYNDERMTTMSAAKYLKDCDVKGKKKKQIIDTVSAVVILQSYLDKGGFSDG